ncbi:MAG: ATP-dependent helicase RecG, ATP-dependent helicase RecG [Candidatus Parcubacteria bacterium]|jgi:ATP-dependent DNA helicase RecG
MPLSPDIPVSEHFRITPIQKDALKKLGIHTLEDLLYHFPARYGDTAEARSIDSLKKGDSVTIYGKITGLKASKGFKTRITMATATVEDETGSIQCVWFNQPYIAKMTPEGALVRIEGKISQRRSGTKEERSTESVLLPDKLSGTGPVADMGEGALRDSTERARGISQQGNIRAPESISAEGTDSGKLYFSNPKLEVVDKLPIGVGDSLFGNEAESHTLYPVYPESRGISSLWIYHSLQKLFKSGLLDLFDDPIPDDILKKYNLPGIKTAMIWMHAPAKNDDAIAARKRFSFQEIFVIQLGRQQARKLYEQYPSFALETDMKYVHEFIRRFPFEATDAQKRAIETIISDMSGERPMSRLLEGDVGSGKTAVAAATAYAIMSARMQIAYMCPTEILAVQHFESFIQYFSYMPVRIALITGSGCRVFPSKVNPKSWTDISRAQLLKWVADGSIAAVIGTQALIQKSVKFKKLAYAIIDEQHRFGIGQRKRLVQKNSELKDAIAPHLLSMTATPIPRTLALTIYGDLDLTVIDQSPAGRKPIITELVLPDKRDATYDKIRRELADGRQLYVICPRIDEPDPDKEAAIIAKSVKEEAKRLKKSVFPQYEIGVLHGKMKPAEKDVVMTEFKSGKIQILCATSVVEVGVNVPNATVIIIEGAERFGLAQLHQLRGRVMRSSHQAYCYTFTDTSSAKSVERLTALATAKNGFELAELDLAQRGAGELSGLRQWGVSDVAMEALKNIKMVEAARTEASQLIGQDPSLEKYPVLKNIVDKSTKDAHFE